MRNKVTWAEKYNIAISEYCTTADIKILLETSTSKAREIRRQVELECKKHNITLYYAYRVPTEIVLKIIKRDIGYYHEKCDLEKRA